MTRRVWMTSIGDRLQVTKAEPLDLEHASVTVRAAQGSAPWDGVWVDGERSYDTYVIIDGVVSYHAAARHLAERCFELHEAAGGGHAP